MVIKQLNEILGITFWRQDYIQRVPRYEVFKVIGHCKDRGLFYFRSVKDNTTISKSFYQLNANGFHPFCLDWARIQKRVEEMSNGPLV